MGLIQQARKGGRITTPKGGLLQSAKHFGHKHKK
jgi:hypothetical protein